MRALPEDLVRALSGGDRRSVGRADAIAREIGAGRVDVGEVVRLIEQSDDAVVRMRAADALEKATRDRPELLEPIRRRLVELLERAEQQEVRWHLAQIVPRVVRRGPDVVRVLACLERYLEDRSSIVKTSALQALRELVEAAPAHADAVKRILIHARDHGTPAMRARARKLLSFEGSGRRGEG